MFIDAEEECDGALLAVTWSRTSAPGGGKPGTSVVAQGGRGFLLGSRDVESTGNRRPAGDRGAIERRTRGSVGDTTVRLREMQSPRREALSSLCSPAKIDVDRRGAGR